MNKDSVIGAPDLAGNGQWPDKSGVPMKRAFTLLELMVVVALIGIVTALILPDMKGTFEDMLLRSTARDLVSACGLASSQAITLHQPHRVRLDFTSGQYLIEKAAHQANYAGGFRPIEDVPGARGDLDERIKVEVHRIDDDETAGPVQRPAAQTDLQWRPSQADVLTFYPDGTAESGEVVLHDRQGFGLVLQINRSTGRVRVKELPRQ
jgi:type II secretion system protein H